MNNPLPEYAIESKNLCKQYIDKKNGHIINALDNLTLNIPRGSLFGLLGPNGAGKSTFIGILSDTVIKTSGKAFVWAIDIDKNHREAKARIGIVPQEVNYDPFFTPRVLLELHAGLYGIPPSKRQTNNLLRAVGLENKGDAYTRTLSGGMIRRLMIAKAMVHSPPILVLDEPTAGVDVELRKQIWAQIRYLKTEGVTILLTTHYLEEAEELCDYIAIINYGKLVAFDTTKALLARINEKKVTVITDKDVKELPSMINEYNIVLKNNRELTFSYNSNLYSISQILTELKKNNIDIADIKTSQASLEDIFIQLTSNHQPKPNNH